MPRGHGRVPSYVDSVREKRIHSLRRSLDQKRDKLYSKEHQISNYVLRNPEQSRCNLFTVIYFDLDDWKLVPVLQHFPSASCSDSSPSLIFLVNPQNENKANLPENTCSLKSSPGDNASGMNAMSQSRNRNKRTKSLKDSSTVPQCLAADSSSGSSCISLSPPSSDVLVSDVTKEEKTVKRSSKKKVKKKGKNSKRSFSKNLSSELEGRCEGSVNTCISAVVEITTSCSPACLDKQISGQFSRNATSPTLFIEEFTIEKDDGKANSNCIDNSETEMSCMSYNDEMEESEAVVSLSSGFCERFNSNSAPDLDSMFSAEQFSNGVKSAICANGNGNSSCISMDHYDSDARVGSSQDCSNSDSNENCGSGVQMVISVKAKGELDTAAEVDSDSRNYDPSCHMTTVNSRVISNGVSNDCSTSESHWREGTTVHTHSVTERAQCSSQASSSNDFRPVVSAKRGRAARKSTAHTEKDYSNPVWQKVQKMDTSHCNNEPKNVHAVSSKVDTSLKASDTKVRLNGYGALKQNSRVKTGKHPSGYEMVGETFKSHSLKVASNAVNLCENNVKKKSTSGSKQVNQYFRKGSNNGNVNCARPSKILAQQKGLKILSEVSDGFSSSGNTDSQPLMVKSTEKTDCCRSVQQQKAGEYIDDGTAPSVNTCSIAGEVGSSPLMLGSLHQNHKVDTEGHPQTTNLKARGNMHEDHLLMDNADNRKLQTECTHGGSSEPDNSSGHVSQKWVPLGRKNASVSCRHHIENLDAPVIDESVSGQADSRQAQLDVTSDAQSCIPLTEGEMQCSGLSSDDICCSSSEADLLCENFSCPSTARDSIDVSHESDFHSVLEAKDQRSLECETDLEKRIHAGNDAYNVQSVAEGVHPVDGSPLAEFERFIRSASPVISQNNHSRNCMVCCGEQRTSNSACLHQAHNISLASIWKWYEEPGCYGLEVKAEDNHKSKRLQNGFVEFRAYFVPYLSAVQLFGRSDSGCLSCNGDVTLSHAVEMALRPSPDSDSLPMSSVPFPKSCKDVDACSLHSASCGTNEFCSQFSKISKLVEKDLIFEYFEHTQPPQRRPLFEKIKELVCGKRSANTLMYGDPSKLECLSLQDLHPASWYAVAWYPIYRIPDGNFRAAFLTFHSLGHFIYQSASSSTARDYTRIICPVVGLQSYNAKKECWFQPRDTKVRQAEKQEVSTSSPSKLLEERLRMLEHTASVMATAKVLKGGLISVNTHPDYNHFFSRW